MAPGRRRIGNSTARPMQAEIAAISNLDVIEGGVEDLIVENGRAEGVLTGDGRLLGAGAVVLTTGTFLNGLIHMGEQKIPAGRAGEGPGAEAVGSSLRAGPGARTAQDRHACASRRQIDRLVRPRNAEGRR